VLISGSPLLLAVLEERGAAAVLLTLWGRSGGGRPGRAARLLVGIPGLRDGHPGDPAGSCHRGGTGCRISTQVSSSTSGDTVCDQRLVHVRVEQLAGGCRTARARASPASSPATRPPGGTRPRARLVARARPMSSSTGQQLHEHLAQGQLGDRGPVRSPGGGSSRTRPGAVCRCAVRSPSSACALCSSLVRGSASFGHSSATATVRDRSPCSAKPSPSVSWAASKPSSAPYRASSSGVVMGW